MDVGKQINLGSVSFDVAIERVTTALAHEGFGILSRIDMSATLKKKLGVDFRPYTILGACNPPLAHKALSAVPEVGLLLPCNVVVEEIDGEVHASIADPMGLLAQLDHEGLVEVACEVAEKIDRVLLALS